jgi:hypothetical protein
MKMGWRWEIGISKWTTGTGSIFCDFTQLPEGSGTWNKGACLLDDEALGRIYGCLAELYNGHSRG